ncbi:hypothetical protein [Parasphingorhabdus sp.]|uniref:hypothetical protein n=1 Tax=Parasphingorhabdus sp. TaxID=2709688 RepID=UPI0030025501
MSEPITLHGMTLAEAESFLHSLGHRHTMSFAEIRQIADLLSDADCSRFMIALEVAATAYAHEAQNLKAKQSCMASGRFSND